MSILRIIVIVLVFNTVAYWVWLIRDIIRERRQRKRGRRR